MNRPPWIMLGILFLIASQSCQSVPFPTGPEPALTPAPMGTPEPVDAQPVPTVETPSPVTIHWWHFTTMTAQSDVWQRLADEYMALHPNVAIDIYIPYSESFKDRLKSAMQSGDPPDIFQSWGGDEFYRYAERGMLRNIDPELDADGGAWRRSFGEGSLGFYSYKDANYGVPWDMGMIGWWYNKALFSRAGIATFPATWSGFLADVTKLKDAGITPISVGMGDKWPGLHLWSYFVTRLGGKAGFEGALQRTGSFTDAPFVEAGRMLRGLASMKPFQDGFLEATYQDEAAAMGNGKAAMELMGQWAPALQKAPSADGKGIGNDLDWAPFPMVEGGKGDPNDAVGGGNGFAIGKNAPDAAVDFVKYLTRPESQRMCASGADDWCIPVVKGGETGMTDPLMVKLQAQLALAKYVQLYYDSALPPTLSKVVNDCVQALFAETMSPEEAAQEIENSAERELG